MIDRPEDKSSDESWDGTPGCAGCGYLLVGLTNGQCPECGRAFDLAERGTFETRPPFRRLLYWLPATVGLALLWLGYAAALLMIDSVGWALTLGVPFTIGFVAGYGAGPGKLAMIWRGCVVLACVVASLIIMNLTGIFCGLILGVIGLLPYLLGAAFGSGLRDAMKRTPSYSQRHYLPLLALCLPAIVELTERRLGVRPTIVAQSTPILLHATLAEACYAGVGERSGIERSVLHAARLTRPLEQVGPRGVGDRSTIRFSKGSLDVVVTAREEPTRFAFDYVGQTHVEDRAIRLIDTTFDYATIDAAQTRLTITTRYEPLMTPRWAWQPFEHWAGTATHELIGRQMQRSVDARRAETRQIIEAEKASTRPTRFRAGS